MVLLVEYLKENIFSIVQGIQAMLGGLGSIFYKAG